MKALFVAVMMAAFVMFAPSNRAEAKGAVVYSAGDDIDFVADIPENIIKQLDLPTDVDLGWKHFKFTLFWMPFYGGSEGSYVLYRKEGTGKTYYDITPQQAQSIGTLSGVTLAETFKLNPLTQFWGWGVALGALLLFAVFGRSRKAA